MSRLKASMTINDSLEPKMNAPLDARILVKYVNDLIHPNSFDTKYVGMVVSVEEDKSLYMLLDMDHTKARNWKKVGADVDTATPEEIEELINNLENL